MSYRRSDTRGEKALGLFLDRFFYPGLCEIEGFYDAQRVFDINEQKAGVDMLITDARGKTIAVDEKAQLHYINAPRRTFAFELSYYNDKLKGISDGWFVNDQNKTNAYILIWINSARTDKLNRIVEEDFNEITVALIAKDKIISYLKQRGYPIHKMKKMAYELRDERRGTNAFMLSKDVFMYYSKQNYDEKPINVIIDKTILWGLAYGVYKVDRTRVVKLKNKN